MGKTEEHNNSSELEKQIAELQPRLISFLLSHFRSSGLSRVDAEDIAQNAIFKALKHRKNYKPTNATLFTYISAIAKNECRDYFRAQKARRMYLAISRFTMEDEMVGLEMNDDAKLYLDKLVAKIVRFLDDEKTQALPTDKKAKLINRFLGKINWQTLFGERYSKDTEHVLRNLRDNHSGSYRVYALDILGFEQDEVAKLLNIPIGTVKSRLSRVREQMKPFLYF